MLINESLYKQYDAKDVAKRLVLGSKAYGVTILLETDMLGTWPKNPDIHQDFIQTKYPGPIADIANELNEIPPLTAEDDKSGTIFPKDDKGRPIAKGYMAKGNLKANGNAHKDNPEIAIKNIRSKLTNTVFIYPANIHFVDENDRIVEEIDGTFERPLQAQTQQGPRTSLATSEVISAGRRLRFIVIILPHKEIDEAIVHKVLGVGMLMGLGQNRGAGFGQFSIEDWTPLEMPNTLKPFASSHLKIVKPKPAKNTEVAKNGAECGGDANE
jgi:hypothetical protein